jgi:hypothetical protein
MIPYYLVVYPTAGPARWRWLIFRKPDGGLPEIAGLADNTFRTETDAAADARDWLTEMDLNLYSTLGPIP